MLFCFVFESEWKFNVTLINRKKNFNVKVRTDLYRVIHVNYKNKKRLQLLPHVDLLNTHLDWVNTKKLIYIVNIEEYISVYCVYLYVGVWNTYKSPSEIIKIIYPWELNTKLRLMGVILVLQVFGQKSMWPDDGAAWKVRGSAKLLQLILRGTQTSEPNLIIFQPVIFDFCYWYVNKKTHM